MESSNQAISKNELHDWVENETRALDVVASWETLCDVYRTLEFNDPLSDAMRLEEFKWIIENMNRHLSRARKKLLNCADPTAMREVLSKMFVSEQATLSNRMDLTYHKLRQMWVTSMITRLDSMMMESMEEEMENGRTDFWNE